MSRKDLSKLEQDFLHGVELFQQKDYSGAEKVFEGVIAADPQGDLADDALYNLGLGYFQQNLFDKAEAAFKKLIEEYPDSTIAEFENSFEHGKTPAKARLGLVNCYLALGRENEAWQTLEELESFSDSWVMVAGTDNTPLKKTFHQLAKELLDKYAQAKQEISGQQPE